jgi:predicted dehydrogenase
MKRRELLFGAAALQAAMSARAQNRPASQPFRVGCMNVVTYSHLPPLWAPVMNARTGRKEGPLSGMHITHCWEIDPVKSEQFAREFGCEPVKNFDDMVGKVDGIISGGFYMHPWAHIIHEPYLKAGLPNLINRPLANSMAKARRILDTARAHNAPVLVPSAFEWNGAIARARAFAKGKKILAYTASNSFDDYPTHGVHGIYMVARAIAESGFPIVSVGYTAKNWHTVPAVMTLEHAEPGGGRFYGALHQVAGGLGSLTIHTPEEYGGRNFTIYSGSEFPFNQSEFWAPAVWAYQQMAFTRDMPQSFEAILHKTQAFLAGWRSILVNEGKPVRLDEVPENWSSPVELPTHPDDHAHLEMWRKKFGPES